MPEKSQQIMQDKATGNAPMKNQNPNQRHNSKKAGLGPNTKR